MKNIHLISTEKPSRIYLIKSNNKLDITSNNPEFTENFGGGTQNQHICITSNEEDINENDYIITRDGRLVQVSYLLSKDLEGASKVILTTDQGLIKDGVWGIEDGFLEWFVKNPDCEFVELRGYAIILPGEWEEDTSEPKQDKKTYSEEEVRKISLDFFYHWWNAKGSNTEQGFDKWFEQVKKK